VRTNASLAQSAFNAPPFFPATWAYSNAGQARTLISAQPPIAEDATGPGDGSAIRSKGRAGYNVPALYGLALGAPYLHHGEAPTLEDLFANPQWAFHRLPALDRLGDAGGGRADRPGERRQLRRLPVAVVTTDFAVRSANARSLVYDGTYLYANATATAETQFGLDGRLDAWDVTVPSAPRLAAEILHIRGLGTLSSTSPHHIVAETVSGLIDIDVTDLTAPVIGGPSAAAMHNITTSYTHIAFGAATIEWTEANLFIVDTSAAPFSNAARGGSPKAVPIAAAALDDRALYLAADSLFVYTPHGADN